MKKKVLTIGGAMEDIFIQTTGIESFSAQKTYIALEEGKKVEIDHLLYFVGGGAANAAVSFKKLGFETTAFFKIGADEKGAQILKKLNKLRINTNYVSKTKKAQTGTSFIIPSPTGNRTALVYRGANLTLKKTDVPWKAVKECDQLYITSLSQKASNLLLPIVAYAKKHNKCVAVNPGSSQLSSNIKSLMKALEYIDILIVNKSEAFKIMNSLNFTTSQLKDYFITMLALGPQMCVVTNGARGVYIGTPATVYFYPSPKVPVISTLGAGDAFGSTFTGLLLNEYSIEQALIGGIHNSASVIGHVGTQTGLLLKGQLDSLIKKAKWKKLKKFHLSKFKE